MTAGGNRRLNLASTSADELPKLIENLRSRYDFIVIDTPPVLPVVDARILGELVDSAVLSALRDKSSVPQMVAAIEVLRAHGTAIMGVVVSGWSSSAYGYYYGDSSN